MEKNGTKVLRRMAEVLRTFRELGENRVPAQHLECLLQIAARPEGIRMADLQAAMGGMAQSSVSRQVQFLGDGSPREPGHKMVKAVQDPEDYRAKIIKLTPKGQTYVNRVLSTMGERTT